MANPMFTPETSTNQIYRDQDDTRCLTDDLDAIEADIEELQTGKANTNHTHDGYAETLHTHSEYAPTAHTHNYAATEHTHEMADVDGLATALAGKAASAHSHAQADVTGLADALTGKASATHTHTASDVGAAASAHTHAQGEVTGLETALAGKANASHTHAQGDVTGLATALAAKADLVDGKVPESQLPSYVSDIVEKSSLSAFPATGAADKIYVAQDTNKTYRWGGTGYVEISASIALGETSATAYRGDRGKVAYEHSQNADVHVTASEKSAWNAKQNALSFDTTPTANSTNPVTSGGIKSALDGKADASHSHNYANSSHTHAQSEITGLETALAGKAATVHSHNNYAPTAHTHDYLPLAGGALKSQVSITRDVSNSYLGLCGGTQQGDGAQLDLCGSGHSSIPGGFQLHARNAEVNHVLRGQVDGTLRWRGNHVLTNSFSMPVDTSAIFLNSAPNSVNGASLRLFGKGDEEAGKFGIWASDGTNQKKLIGTPSGSLTWDGNDVVTANGAKMTIGSAFSRNINTSYLGLNGGTSSGNGAHLDLCGKEHANYPGYFNLHANNGTTSKLLQGKPDGNLSWNGTMNATKYNTTSDARLKSDIKPIENALDKLEAISGCLFTMDGERSAGVIAQEVEKVLPEAVMTNEEGYKSVNYNAVLALLIEAVKELKR